MATLTNTKIKDTYKSILKVSDNGNLEAGLQEITDGEGNASGVQLNTGGDLTASGTVAFGSLKDSGENITITKFVDEADGIGSNDNDTSIPTSAAVKNYVDTNVTAQDLDFAGDSGTGAVDLDSQTFTIAGTANEIETSASGQTITIGLPSTITANVTGNVSGNLTGTVLTAAQTNITSVGTLSSLAVSGNLAVDTNTLYVDAANNRVGIGTSSPASKIDSYIVTTGAIGARANANIALSSNGAVDTRSIMIFGKQGVGGYAPAYFGFITTDGTGESKGDIIFGTRNVTTDSGATERLRIDSSGNVGIGESNPDTKLHIHQAAVIRMTNTANTSGFDIGLVGGDANDDGFIYNRNSGSNLIFGTANTERMRITSDGYMRMASGTGGIQFGGDTAAANTLDDYEEGTWTMGISFDGASVGATYSANTGQYTKIGRQVTVTGRLQLSNKGTSTGNARITGLPFTVGATSGHRSPGSLLALGVSFANQVLITAQIGTTEIVFGEMTEAGSYTDLNETNFTNTSIVDVSITYLV